MAEIDQERLRGLEAKLGVALPVAFKESLSGREPIREGSLVIVTTDRIWDVRETYSLDLGDEGCQLDGIYT